MRIDPNRRWRWAFVALAATSCGSKPSVAPIPPITNRSDKGTPEVVFVAANDDTLRFVKTTPAGLVVTRTVTVPGSIAALAWVGPEPVVMINDSDVGHISPAGYEPFPPVPAALWSVPKPDRLSPHMDTPLWQLIVDAKGVVWQARCEWGPGKLKNGEIICDAWVYARLSGPMTISRTEPTVALELSLPTIEPSTTTRVEIVSLPAAPDAGAAIGSNTILRCTEAGKTIEFPPEHDRDEYGRYAFEGVSDLTWITTAPPMFRITEDLASQRIDVIFEGCEVSPVFGFAHIVSGPHEVIAIFNDDKLSVRQHGQEIGTLDRASLVRFAPEP